MARDAGAPAAYLVDDASAIEPGWLEGVHDVGVTSGASVPEDLVDGVLDRLAEHGFGDVEEVEAVEERMVFALPRELRPHAAASAVPRPDRPDQDAPAVAESAPGAAGVGRPGPAGVSCRPRTQPAQLGLQVANALRQAADHRDDQGHHRDPRTARARTVASVSSVPSAAASNVLPVAVTSSAVTSATRNSSGGVHHHRAAAPLRRA